MSTVRVAVVGGGITGLAAALELEALAAAAGAPLAITLLEGDARLGGKVQTDTPGQLVIEEGPDSMVRQKPWGVDLARRLGLEAQLVATAPQGRQVYLAQGDSLRSLPPGWVLGVPTTPLSLWQAPLLSWPGKVRAAREPLVPPATDPGDESLGAFLTRRLGAETAQKIAGPILASIAAGRAGELSLRATFPQLARLEREHGSLTEGLRRQRARTGPQAGPSPSPFVTLSGGLAALPAAAAQALQATRILLNTPVTTVSPVQNGYRVRAGDGAETFAGVVMTVPGFAAAPLLAGFPEVADPLAAIPYADTAVVALAFRRSGVSHPLDGSGFLVPATEERTITGCTWLSSKWPHTTPQGTVLVRSFVGRRGSQAALALSDEELVEAVLADLNVFLGITEKPLLSRVYRWPRGMPQYVVGHLDRVEAIKAAAAGLPGLELAGAALEGVGIPDCIRQGQEAARRLAAHLWPQLGQPQPKQHKPDQPQPEQRM